MKVPPLSIAEITARLRVDCDAGRCYWIDATKHHARLNGLEAGTPKKNQNGKYYWVIKLNGIPYKRAQIVLAIKTQQWPDALVDHKNGDSLDDAATNLRHASILQNAWNHKKRAKRSPLPMGVRLLPRAKGFQARVTCNHKTHHLGVFQTPELAHAAYLNKRQELFGEFA